jgi:MFS family permease
MIRTIIGFALALAGATAAVWSPFWAWYNGRHGHHYGVDDLFGGGLTDAEPALIGSMFLPMIFAALVTLVALALRSRLLVAFAGLIVLAFTTLWMIQQGRDEGSLTVAGDGSGLDVGVALAAGGGALLLLASAVLPDRKRRRARHRQGQGRPPAVEPPKTRGPAEPSEAPARPDVPADSQDTQEIQRPR